MSSLLNPKVFDSFPNLTTQRTHLREFRTSDNDEFYLIRTDAEIRKFIAKPIDLTKEQTLKIIEEIKQSFKEKASLNWVIEHKLTKEFMGSAGFWRIDLEHGRAEIGYSIKKKFWAQGYMEEVLNIILPFAFSNAGIHSVMANVNVANIASWKLLEKVGFVREAHHREDWYFKGKWYDTLVYGLLEKDFKEVL